jgi:2-oxoglutarate ferredoxin oxidoreductase subunit delta
VKTGPKERFWRTPFDTNMIPRLRGNIHVQEERCKGCAFCVEFCPTAVLVMSERRNLKGYHPPDIVKADDCYACRLCEIMCPEFAIQIEEKVTEPADASR